MTSKPDGHYCHAAEGGAIACFNADPNDPAVQTNYEWSLWRRQVSSQGVMPVELLQGPDADFTVPINTFDPNALIYVAGGREGWRDAQGRGVSTGEAHAVELKSTGRTAGSPRGSGLQGESAQVFAQLLQLVHPRVIREPDESEGV